MSLPANCISVCESHQTWDPERGPEERKFVSWMIRHFSKDSCRVVNTRGQVRKPLSILFAVQSLSLVQPFATPWTAACRAFLSLTISWSLPKSCALSQWCFQPSHLTLRQFSRRPRTGKISSLSTPHCFKASFSWSWLCTLNGGHYNYFKIRLHL